MNRIVIPALFLAAGTAPVHAEGLKADVRGLTLEEGPLELNLGGRLHLDAAVFDDAATARTGVTDAAVRRARLELSGKIGGVVRFRIDREFAGASKGWRNLWVGIAPLKNVELRGGNMMAPFSAEDLQSSNSLPFTERSLASALAPGYGLGGTANASGKRWSATLGWFTDALDNDEGRSVERGRGAVGRATLLAVSNGHTRLHFGAGGERRTFRAGETLRFSGDAGSTRAPNIMSTGTLRDLDHLSSWSAEAGLSFGPVLVQAQAMGQSITRNAAPRLAFNGQTIQASWLLGGRGYGYTRASGNFSGPELRRGKGAVEIAARYSRLDLRNGAIDRGIGTALTGGANWYLSRNVRLMANFTRTRATFADGTPRRTNNVGVARFQLSF